MKRYLSVVFLFFSGLSFSQSLRDINYEYLYNPDAPVNLQLKPLRGETSFTLLYSLQVKDTSHLMNEYSIEWQGRNQLFEKEGPSIALNEVAIRRNASGFEGLGTLERATAPKYIVAKVTKNSARQAWVFYTALEPNYPVNNYLETNGTAILRPFVRTHEEVRLARDGEWIVSYYSDNFPAAAPAFSEAQARVSPVMAVDSVFKVSGGEDITFSKKGLYLIQHDTNSVEGFAFRSEEDYPQYSKVASLAGPLIYITTRQEYDRLESTQGNKRAFDRIILTIAMDTDRARILMRNYFRRVELANRYFTSYKEGWKTDRGMIYIVFGAPQQVLKFEDREVWSYKNDDFEGSFNFSRSSSLFDPNNFVLIREKKYEDNWYELIDLWRNARF